MVHSNAVGDSPRSELGARLGSLPATPAIVERIFSAASWTSVQPVVWMKWEEMPLLIVCFVSSFHMNFIHFRWS
jgi:hypothetical protein